ncbi:MAG: hypothetical protein CVU89_03410 [Firmicutes bacterium HGW-Firmicutes-14]|jgi:RNA polymerase-binding transcription factor DksA|nr:MAG: hypothetical protein CVU89_03410 [Firmicutes bacterium HGW-Firmicutes-14]
MAEINRLKTILNDLNCELNSLAQRRANLRFTPDFNSLADLLESQENYESEAANLDSEIQSLNKLKPVLEEAITQAEQAEKAEATEKRLKELAKQINKTVSQLKNAEFGTVEQANLLLKLSELNKEVA